MAEGGGDDLPLSGVSDPMEERKPEREGGGDSSKARSGKKVGSRVVIQGRWLQPVPPSQVHACACTCV